jgi:D-alanyl-D-alanine carboxypeptidase
MPVEHPYAFLAFLFTNALVRMIQKFAQACEGDSMIFSGRVAVGIAAISFLITPNVRAAAPNQPPSITSAATRAAIVTAVERERKRYGGRTPVPGVLVGVWDGHGHSFILPVGYADLKTKRPMSASDHFRVGSNTKTFVVGVILQLVDEGKLSLDDPVDKFDLGVSVPNGAKITVRQLCDMRSGLFEAYDVPEIAQANVKPDSIWNPRTIIAWAVKQKPYFAPNAGYHYSNTNYLLLGLIIEAVTKDTVAHQIRKRLIEPFGLTHTSYPDTMSMPDPWAHGYGLDEHRNWEDVSNTIPVTLMGAAGEMISDMNDMRHWIEAYVGGKVSKPATHAALMRCVYTGEGNLSFGLALGCSAGWYGYTGGLPGYNTADYYFPKTGEFIVAWVPLQANKPAPGVASAMFRAIASILTPNNIPFQLSGSGKSGL